jgi:alpha-1,3-rhamnosyl/mannosyltransferase
MMRIGLGVTVLARGVAGNGVDGIGTYTRNLGAELARRDDAAVCPVAFGTPIPDGEAFDTGEGVELGRFEWGALRTALLSGEFPGASVLSRRIDLFHSPDHRVPRLRKVPVLATIHDAIPLSHPEWVNPRLRRLKGWFWRHSARWADHIVTVSAYSREQILAHFPISDDRVSVIPNGVNEEWFVSVGEARRRQVLDQLGLSPGFFLTIGTLQPRKNVAGVVRAHSLLPRDVRQAFPLVVVGKVGWQCDEAVRALKALESRGEGVWLAYLPDDVVRALFQSARGLIFPSLAEGFGLPVLEAFASGLPVVTSTTTALPEVAGDAAILVAPRDTAAITGAMARLADDDELVATMRWQGRERARAFTWRRCAEQTVELYRTLL